MGNTKNTKYLFHRISDWTPTRSLNKRTLMNWKFNRMWLTRDRFHMIFNLIQLVSGSVPRLQIETPKSDTRSLTMRFLKTVRSNSTWFKSEEWITYFQITLNFVVCICSEPSSAMKPKGFSTPSKHSTIYSLVYCINLKHQRNTYS